MTIPARKFELLLGVSFALIAAFWILIRLPALSDILLDGDGGHQLAGAIQTLHGEIPFVDFHVTYGPLTFYSSALAQIILPHRVIGEFLLNILGYAIAYALLAIMIYRATGNAWISSLFVVFALAAIPRLYKYYIVLGPAVTLWTIWRYIEQPNRKNILLMVLAITATGLFRADFGVYCAIAGTLTVLIHPAFKDGGIRRAFTLLSEIFLVALPWLLFLLLKGGLGNYFHDMVIGGIDAAEGLALPFPALRFDIPLLSPANLSVLALFFFFCFPFLIWLLLALRWKSIADLERKKLIATAALCSLSLLQGSHRVDYPHLLQAVPLVFVLGGWAANSLWQASKANKAGNAFYLAPFVVMLAFFSLPVSLIRYSSWPKVDLAGSVGKIRAYALPNKELLASIVQKEMADQSEAEIMQYIDRCTTEHQRLLVLPNLSTYYFYVDRAFGGGQMLVGPGYFSSVSDQNRMVARMARQDIPLIVYYPNFVYDNMPNRKFSAFAPNVLSYMESNYMNILPAGPVELMLRNDLNVERQGDTLSGFSCPQPK